MELFFGRSALPRKWGANTDKNRLLPAVCDDLAPKAQSTKNVFMKALSQRAHFFCISPAPRYLCGPCFKVIARTDHGNPAVLFPQRCKPHLANWQKKMCLNSTFFRYSARSPHRATKPSQGRLRVGGRKPRFLLSNADPTRNKVTANERTGVLGCGGK